MSAFLGNLVASAWAAGVSLVALAVVIWPLELLFPARRGQRLFRPGWGTDLAFFAGQYLVWIGLAGVAVHAFDAHVDPLVPRPLRDGFAAWPLPLQAVVVVLLGDLSVYWFHRACHALPFLWRFHAVHHSAEHLDWLAAHREHPVDGLLTQLAVNLPAIVLGFSLGQIAWLIALRGMWAIFIHSNVRLPLGPLRVLLGAPELHHWHHLRGARAQNFANLAPWTDLLFGTYHHPRGPEVWPLGSDEPLPPSYLGMLARPVWPARSWVSVAVLLAFAGACGGDEKPITYTPVSATSEGNLHTLTLGDLKMVVDASTGARITEFSLRGTNALVTKDENVNYGATYWPSPQSIWCAPTGTGDCWPPPEAIDSGPYAGSTDAANLLHLESAQASIATVADSAIAVGKHFRPVPESGAIDVSYTLTNRSPTVSISLAPWQVSRVAAGGLTFFLPGSVPTYAPDSDPTFLLAEGAGHLWYASAPVRHDSKAFADGTGWLAHVTPQRLLCVQSFPDLPAADAAPGEAEIEVFTNSSYVEIEAQGGLTELAPGSTLTWTVRWKLRRLPGGKAVAAGDAELTTLAWSTLEE